MHEEAAPIPAEALLRHAGFLRALACGLLGDETLAEDAVQETFVRAIERPPRDASLLPAWLRRVATHVVWKWHRTHARREQREHAAARPETVRDVHEAESAEVLRRVTDAVLALEEPYRTTVLLRYYEDLGTVEIAARQGVPASTVRSRLQRAHAKLRERLDRDERGRERAWALVLAGIAEGGRRRAAPEARTGPIVLVPSVAGKLLLAVVILAGALAVGPRWQQGRDPAPSQPDVAVRVQAETLGDAARDEVRGERALAVDTFPGLGSTAASESFGTIAVRVLASDGRTPLSGARLTVLPWGSDDPQLDEQEERSDADGRARFERVHAGRALVRTHHATGSTVAVDPGRETGVELVVREGLTVLGEVVDREGRAVSDARVWVSAYFNNDGGLDVGPTGADGRFRLESMTPACYVGVRSKNLGPSELSLLEGKPGETVSIRFELAGPAGRVPGLVVDVSGRPIAGARTRLVDGTSWPVGGAPIEVRKTDAQGRFVFEGVRAGSGRIEVRARGFGPAETGFELAADGDTELRITLSKSAYVHGTVRGPTGESVEGASVGVGEYGKYLSSRTRSRADGSYRLVHVAPGNVQVWASEKFARQGRALGPRPTR